MLPAPGIYCPNLPSTYLPVLYLIFYRRMLEEQASLINIDCMDPLGKDLVLDSRILASSLKIALKWSSKMSWFLSLCSGRTALLMGIDNENLEMIELLLEFKVKKILLDGQHNYYNIDFHYNY